MVIEVLKSIWKIVFPFALGGAIAFVINVPMSFLEKKMLGKIKENNKIGKKAARPISLLLTIILVAGVIILVMFGVIPQLTQTMGNLMTSISDFIPQMQNWIREFSHDNQDIMKLVDQLQFQPDQAIKWGISLLGNGVGNMMNTTMSAVGSIASGLATFFISFSFACYILFQVGLPSIWVLAAVTIGGNLMGIIGMLIFIPLVSVFYTIFREFVYLRLKKQHIKRVTRTDVEEYAEEEIASSFIVPNEK